MTPAGFGAHPAAAGERHDAPLLSIDRLCVQYDDDTAAAPTSASFTVRPGEVVLLLGPSGSGKSTLALTINGLIPEAIPARLTGSVTVAGHDAATTPVSTLSTHVGMVFQDPDAQLVTGTLLDEVAFGPENLRLPVAEVLARAESALRRVGLWERRNENPDRLSGGGRQRLAIACALAMKAPQLVLDEPTANLDPQGIEEVYAALADLVAGGEHAIVLIEHNLDTAVAFTDRVVVLDAEGRTAFDGSTDEVLRDHAAALHAMGVWLPVSTLAALRLRDAGWPLDRLPLTPGELRAAVKAVALGEADAVTAAITLPHRGSAESEGGVGAEGGVGGVRAVGGGGGGARPAPAPVVTVRDLHLRRGRREVLHGVDLTVHEGEFVAIVGGNGAGKTSLIQAIAGVVPVPRGTVHVGDLDVARVDRRALSRRIGFVFQNPEHQFIAHTVFDELAHGLRQQRLPEEQVRARVEEILERFGLHDKASQHPFLLSGGQKRRLSVGTQLVTGADILALDEPTFGQDRARADELLHLLSELQRGGTTIIVVTHDMQLVTEYADRTVVVRDARIVADAATSSVFADETLLLGAGLRLPPLRRAFAGLPHAELAAVTRLDHLDSLTVPLRGGAA